MDDREVTEAFATGGARHAFGEQLHVEGDCLVLDGWWEAAFRVAPGTFAVRDEASPRPTDLLDRLRARLQAAGLRQVEADPALLVAITYTAIDLGAADWTLWSSDEAAAEAALAARAGHDTFLDTSAGDTSPIMATSTPVSDYAAEMGGARRSAGLPALVILTVGIDDARVAAMAEVLADCHLEARSLGELDAGRWAALLPNLALVDATTPAGQAVVADLRREGTSVPLVAVHEGGPLEGADATVDPAESPGQWAAHLRALLP
ncbi:MAG: hypothetical protein M3P97_03730 [Actinomycetota bacterium]|nr:hypothetical protein [Actinomycetota bacterium]